MPSSSSSSPCCLHLPPAPSQHSKHRSMDHPSPKAAPTSALITQSCCSWFFFFHLPHQPCGQGPCLIHLGRSEQGLARESCPQAAELAVQMDKQGHSASHPSTCPSAGRCTTVLGAYGSGASTVKTESLGLHTTAWR